MVSPTEPLRPLAAVAPSAADAAAERERVFARFVAEHRDRAIRVAWRLVGGDDASAEDVAQDALVRAWRALPRFRGEAALSTWFYRILVRQAANHRRWRGVRDRVASDEEVEDAPDRGERGDPLLRARIAEALARLSPRQREAFVLVAFEGFTAADAAKILRRREGTVKSHLNRARVALRRELADLAHDPGAEP